MLRPLLYQLMRIYWRVFRPTTLGSRTLVVKNRQVLLVRLTYVKGWHMPGGGVKRGESFQQAAVRELREECSLQADGTRLLQVFFCPREGKQDHVALYLVENFTELAHRRDAEIAEMRFFPVDALPTEITPATRRRVEEYLAGGKYDSRW